jgi:xanthine dehydrogenase accessory factor
MGSGAFIPAVEPLAPADAWSAGLAAVITRMRALRSQSLPFALCLVTQTEGSSYRKPGAIALVSDDRREGVISGGCLESDLELYARQALAARTPRCVVFDTLADDDLLFGSGSGCRGRMHVLIVPDSGPYRALSDALLAADGEHLPLEAVLFIDGPAVGSGACWYGDHEVAVAAGLEILRDQRTGPVGLQVLKLPEGSAHAARFTVPPVPRLLIIGAGPEALPLLHIARGLGWRAVLADHRPALVQAVASMAEAALVARPAEALSLLASHPLDACVIMSHTASNDLEALRAVAAHPVRYVGLLGPPARRDELLRQLDAPGRAALSARLHAPAGLSLGGHGPEALALSIAAELQQHFAARR